MTLGAFSLMGSTGQLTSQNEYLEPRYVVRVAEPCSYSTNSPSFHWTSFYAETETASDPVFEQLLDGISIGGNPETVIATKIKSYADMPMNWDSNGGEPISTVTITEALEFVSILNDLNLVREGQLPHISPAGDGEIAFEWNSDDDHLEVSFYGDGELYWYFRRGENRKTGSEKFALKSFSRELEQYIIAISS